MVPVSLDIADNVFFRHMVTDKAVFRLLRRNETVVTH